MVVITDDYVPYRLKLGCTLLSASVKRINPTDIHRHAIMSYRLNFLPATLNSTHTTEKITMEKRL
jgi:hypothetical protein